MHLKQLLDNKTNRFFLITLILLFTEISSFLYLADICPRTRIIVLTALCESLFLLLPFFIVPPKLRCYIWIIFIIYPFFMLTELLYLRHFGNFYYGNIILAGDITDSSVINSSIAILKPSDLLPFIPSLIFPVPYYIYKQHIITYRCTKKVKLICGIIILAIPFILFIISVRRFYNWTDPYHRNRSHITTNITDSFLDPSWKPRLTQDYGVLALGVRTVCDLFPKTISLSDREITDINGLIDSSASQSAPLTNNKNKNLILLIVESLNSSVLTLEAAPEICPNLYNLSRDSNTVYVPVVIGQTGPGVSSDGQLIYNTGLLPLRSQAFVTEYGLSHYPSLSKALKSHANSEIIYENKTLWNHWSTTRSYGYDHLYCNLAKDAGKSDFNEDLFVINKTIAVSDTIRQPFFLQVTTYSTHEPYDKLRVTRYPDQTEISVPGDDRLYVNYLESVRFFDSQLGRLIEYLKEKNIFETTILTIIGDHPAPSVSMSPALDSKSVPLIIHNAGIDLKYDKTIGQIDIFPTLLDVMGVDDYILPQTGRSYRGLGRSLLSDNPPETAMNANGEVFGTSTVADSLAVAETFGNIWHLSELMILSRFFDK